MIRTYTELIKLPTFEERFEYLKLNGRVGSSTFGRERYLNQVLYKSPEWISCRDRIIVRDNGCDLGIEDRPIIPINSKSRPSKTKFDLVYIHHLNPISIDDIINRSRKLFDPENLITVSYKTHQAIHYGSIESLMGTILVERAPNDTCLWKK